MQGFVFCILTYTHTYTLLFNLTVVWTLLLFWPTDIYSINLGSVKWTWNLFLGIWNMTNMQQKYFCRLLESVVCQACLYKMHVKGENNLHLLPYTYGKYTLHVVWKLPSGSRMVRNRNVQNRSNDAFERKSELRYQMVYRNTTYQEYKLVCKQK